MKIIAYFLPQFHEIKENNAWWGKGFTEWTNIKNARSYFSKHIVSTPLNENYYNLLDTETIRWQTKLANEYGVYGFCYYHYWFSGRKILEKPAELLLDEKDIPQKFCFCWANHTWKKTWNGSSEILIEQSYGAQEEWQEHFKYLYEFFKDDRYIKIDGKPIFMIYDAKNIPNFEDRIKFYDMKCRENGLKGIYIIESINHKDKKNYSYISDAITLREPAVALSKNSFLEKIQFKIRVHRKNKFLKPFTLNFNKVIKRSLNIAEEYVSTKTIMLGSFTGWDSTPRHKNRGYILLESTPKEFRNYLLNQKSIIEKNNLSNYVFINAWNEWAEGMQLEPTQQYRYEYLEVIKEVCKKDMNSEDSANGKE